MRALLPDITTLTDDEKSETWEFEHAGFTVNFAPSEKTDRWRWIATDADGVKIAGSPPGVSYLSYEEAGEVVNDWIGGIAAYAGGVAKVEAEEECQRLRFHDAGVHEAAVRLEKHRRFPLCPVCIVYRVLRWPLTGVGRVVSSPRARVAVLAAAVAGAAYWAGMTLGATP